MVLHTWRTMIFESPTTLSTTMLRLMDFRKPKTSASYLAVLFMHSNSKQLETKCFLFLGSIKTHSAPMPSYVLDPSKYKVHMPYVQGPLATLVVLTLLLLLLQCNVQVSFLSIGKGRSPYVCLVGWGLATQDNTPSTFPERNLWT